MTSSFSPEADACSLGSRADRLAALDLGRMPVAHICDPILSGVFGNGARRVAALRKRRVRRAAIRLCVHR